MATIYTIGHGTRTGDELVAVLRPAEVVRIVDVRRFPGSRRYPHWARAAMEVWLPHAGIGYDWRGEELGGRRRATAGPTRHPAWRMASFRAYADYMDTDEFAAALQGLATDAGPLGPLAIMCAETLWWRCHRRLIADALVVQGLEMIHLVGPSKSEPHKLHPALRMDGRGRPVYDVGETPPLIEG